MFSITLASLLASLLIFPLLFAANGDPAQGPQLAFIVMPSLFIGMPEALAHAVAEGDKGFIQESTGVMLIPFIYMGAKHMVTGYDHLLFLLGLLLLGGSLWRLATIVTAFTVGHSVTLSLAALDVVQVSPSLVEPAIALSIVVVGVDNLLVRQRPAAARGAPGVDLRPFMAVAFGLIHGFGFAAVLREVGLPPGALAWSLAAFNLGVELGQLAVVGALVAVLAAVRRYDVVLAESGAVVASMVVIGAGLFWFAQRIGLIA